MKIVNYTVLITLLSGMCLAQDEPETFNKKDLIETVDRSELEGSDDSSKSKSNVEIPKFEMPTIEFDENVKPKKSSVDTTVKVKKTPSKPSVIKTGKSKPVVKAPVQAKPKPVVKASVPVKTKPVVKKVIESISISDIIKNDKFVVSKDKISVFRFSNSKNNEYSFSGKLPINSQGLKASKNDSYYVINRFKLIQDFYNLNKSEKETVIKPEKKATQKINPVVKLDAKVISTKKDLENKYNNGNSINKDIELSSLRIDDKIYIVNGLQLVLRQKPHSTAQYKYWLNEKLDINKKAVSKISENLYKIIEDY